MDKNEKLYELLEPRILLNAALDFTVSDTLDNIDTIETMSALIRTFEDQFDPGEDGLLNLLRTELIDGLDGTEDLFSLVEGQGGTGFGELEDIFERVRLSGMQVVEDYRADLNSIFADAVFTDAILDLTEATRSYAVVGGLSEVENIDNAGLTRINGVELAEGTTLSDHFRSAEVTDQILAASFCGRRAICRHGSMRISTASLSRSRLSFRARCPPPFRPLRRTTARSLRFLFRLTAPEI